MKETFNINNLKAYLTNYFADINPILSKGNIWVCRIIINNISSFNKYSFFKNLDSVNKIYWLDREDKLEIAGYINLLNKEELNSLQIPNVDITGLSDEVRIFKWRMFSALQKDSLQNSYWDRFNKINSFLPLFGYERNNDKEYLYFNIPVESSEKFISIIDNIFTSENGKNTEISTSPVISEIENITGKDDWKRMMSDAGKLFSSERMEKIVLCRKNRIKFENQISPEDIFIKLLEKRPFSTRFFIGTKNGMAFMGATPERLFKRNGQDIESDALAGTTRRGAAAEEDELLGKELLESGKDNYEHDIVISFLKESYKETCSEFSFPESKSLMKLPTVQHLFTKFRGILKQNISNENIIDILHPTPAVGGIPQKLSLEKIREIEGFCRGLYAAPIGWEKKGEADYCVAIRSGLYYNGELILYTGAGIVPDSDADMEWSEIDNKMKNFIGIFKNDK